MTKQWWLAGILFCSSPWAQELSPATYVGSLEGAVEACARAFPEQEETLRRTLRRSMNCHMSDKEFTQWHDALRKETPQREDYQDGFILGKGSLGRSPADRAQQCESLTRLTCDTRAEPRGGAGSASRRML